MGADNVWLYILYIYIFTIYNFESSKLPDECGPCTIRNSSVAIKRWLLVKPELLWSYSWCSSINWVERSTKYVLLKKRIYIYYLFIIGLPSGQSPIKKWRPPRLCRKKDKMADESGFPSPSLALLLIFWFLTGRGRSFQIKIVVREQKH